MSTNGSTRLLTWACTKLLDSVRSRNIACSNRDCRLTLDRLGWTPALPSINRFRLFVRLRRGPLGPLPFSLNFFR